jgi:hypothetical protein
MSQKITIQDFYGKILGWIDVDDRGNKTVQQFAGPIVGYYRKSDNVTTDFYGRIIARGDVTASLLMK